MATHTLSIKDAASDETQSPVYGLMFELEFLAVPGREAAFNVYKSLLKDYGVEFSEGLFCRLVNSPRPEMDAAEVAAAVGLKSSFVAKMEQDVRDGLRMFYASQECRLLPALVALLQAAVERGLRPAAVTALENEDAARLVEKLELNRFRVALISSPDADRLFPGADVWLQAARKISVNARRCIALCSTNDACRSALAAGMRVIAVPDRFTAFHDFSGSEAVIDDFDSLDAGAILDELTRSTYVAA